jgi:hypothetical protein
MRRLRLITVFIALLVAASTLGALPASAAPNPLGNGLGAKRAAFEARFGKPVDDRGAGDFATGTKYRVPGYAAVYVYWHKDVAARIVLVAKSGWEGEEAVDIAKRFLPTDATFATSGSGSNKRGQAWAFANGHSAALGKRLSANTYRKYGVGGAQGDLRLALMADRNGEKIVLIDIAIGQGQKFAPPTSAPKQSVPGHTV